MSISYNTAFTCLMAMSLAGCSRLATDTRSREWSLPGGEFISFSHEDPGFFGSDHAKYLDVRFKGGNTKRYSFAAGHSGYNEVNLLLDQSHKKLWLIDCHNSSSLVFLDLSTGSFKDEGSSPPIVSNASILPARRTSAATQ